MKTSAKDLRLHTRRILEAIDRGQEVTITHRGKPRATIVPIKAARGSGRKSARDLPLFGIWKDHKATKNVAAYIDERRRNRF